MQQAAAVLRGNHVTCRLSGTEFESDSVIISVTAITVKRCGPQSDTSDSSRTEARGKKSIKASCQDEEWRLRFHLDVRSGSNIRTCSRRCAFRKRRPLVLSTWLQISLISS